MQQDANIDTIKDESLLSTASPKDYLDLLKPRVMSLVVFTALVGMVAAPGAIENWVTALISLLAIAVGAGASGALNMWYDADIDQVMERTKTRPIPAGKIKKAEAFAFGIFLSILSVMLLAMSANYLAAGLLAFTIFFYAVVYTMFLKRNTPQNIVIGGAAGALPPVVGWAAITGAAPLDAWWLFALIFFWTPPHFWALNLVKSADYEAANIPMMPNAKGITRTKIEMVVYAFITAFFAISAVWFHYAGALYAIFAIVMSVLFVIFTIDVARKPNDERQNKSAMRLFVFSIFYLFLLNAVLLWEHWAGIHF